MVNHERPVRYTTSKPDAGWLRLVLVKEWGSRCFYCGAPGDVGDFEIDHIVPRTRFSELREGFGLPEATDKDDVENLAPICAARGRCNQVKSDAVEHTRPRLLDALSQARERADRVRRQVVNLRKSQDVHQGLMTALADDLTDESRSAFKQYGHQLAQRLYSVDEDLVESYLSYRQINHPFQVENPHADDDEWDKGAVVLNGAGRREYWLAKEVCAVDLDQFLTDGLWEVMEQISQSGSDAARSQSDEELTFGDFTATRSGDLYVDEVSHEWDGDELVITMAGDLGVGLSASIAFAGWNGEPAYGQVEISYDGRFSIEGRGSAGCGRLIDVTAELHGYVDLIELSRY